MSRRAEFVDRIVSERVKNFNLPGAEWDAKNSPNDWIAIAATYLTGSSSRKHTVPSADEFEDDLVKAAAVILAALEHVSSMRDRGTLR